MLSKKAIEEFKKEQESLTLQPALYAHPHKVNEELNQITSECIKQLMEFHFCIINKFAILKGITKLLNKYDAESKFVISDGRKLLFLHLDEPNKELAKTIHRLWLLPFELNLKCQLNLQV